MLTNSLDVHTIESAILSQYIGSRLKLYDYRHESICRCARMYLLTRI